MSDKKTIVSIKGMHCRSCELLVEGELCKIDGVKKARVSYKNATAEIFSKNDLKMGLVKDAICKCGYEIGQNEKKSFFNTDISIYKELVFAIVILAVIYFGWKSLGLSTNFNFGSPSNLFVVLLIGLTAGISTCMAMVGGLILGVAARYSETHPNSTPLQKFRPHLFFNLGRIVSYIIFGGLIGWAGSILQFSGTSLGILTIIVGLIMIMLGLQLTEVFPRLSNGRVTLPTGLSKLLGIKNDRKEYSHRGSLILGALTFFLPCGFTQAMQLYAISTGSFVSGALVLGIFAIGTAPGLLGVGGLSSIVRGKTARIFFRFVGVVVIALAILNISNGMNLTGWKVFSIPENSSGSYAVPLENGIQIVHMTQSASGYSPNKFTIRKGVPVKWVINSTDSSSCANTIVAGSLGIKTGLKPGETSIDFTPYQTGEINFSCVMGMYRGKFIVIENDSDKQSNVVGASPVPTTTPTTLPKSVRNDDGYKIINLTYTAVDDILPKQIDTSVGQKTRILIDVKDEGSGCMSTVMIPGLVQTPQYLEKGSTLSLDFTPNKAKTYQITCAMGVPRGQLIVE